MINILKSLRNFTTYKQAMRPANLKKFNIKNENEDLFNQMINRHGLSFLKKVFNENGHEIRIAGGAVRDLLCEKVPDDIDLATTAKPDFMIDILKKFDNVRLITTKAGERHGTVTARIDNLMQYELTTLRIDKITDGRHAEVEFIEDWKLDASRRDLTFNSLFLDFDGIIYDYFDGIEHLKKKKVMFVGDAKERIEEDYLRILRYFRFYVRYGNLIEHDQLTIDAINKTKEGLNTISGPRLWTELKKILSYENSISILDIFFNQLELGIYLGFNSNKKDVEKVKLVSNNLKKFKDLNKDELKLNSLLLVSALIDDENELINLRERLNLSNQELYTANELITNKDLSFSQAKNQLILTPKSEQVRKKSIFLEVFKYCGNIDDYYDFKNLVIPQFPNITSELKKKILQKNLIGYFLNKLKEHWVSNDCKLSKEQLLEKFEIMYQKHLEKHNVKK